MTDNNNNSFRRLLAFAHFFGQPDLVDETEGIIRKGDDTCPEFEFTLFEDGSIQFERGVRHDPLMAVALNTTDHHFNRLMWRIGTDPARNDNDKFYLGPIVKSWRAADGKVRLRD
jgi:hypothetical protein